MKPQPDDRRSLHEICGAKKLIASEKFDPYIIECNRPLGHQGDHSCTPPQPREQKWRAGA